VKTPNTSFSRRIASFLSLVVLVLLFVTSAFIVGVYSYFTLTGPLGSDARRGVVYILLFLMAVAFVVIACPFLPGLSRNKLMFYLRIPVFLGLLAFLIFQLVDAPPPKELYTKADFSTSGPVANDSSLLLERLIVDDAVRIPDLSNLLNSDQLQDILQHRGDIEKAWTNIIGKRQIIQRLAGYPILENIKAANNGLPLPLHNISRIAHIYQLYALLQARGGNLVRAVATVCSLQEVAGKAMAGSSYLVQKMIWLSVARTNLRVIYRIVLDNRLMPSELGQIQTAFAPLTDRELSFTMPWLEIYLSDKDRLGHSVEEIIKGKSLPGGNQPLFLRLIPGWLRTVMYRLTFQPNRTLAMLQTFWAPVIEQSKKGRLFGDIHPSGQKTFVPPPLQNLSGWYFFRPPDFTAYDRSGLRLKVQTGMFIVFLNTKLRNADIQPLYRFSDARMMIFRDKALIWEGNDGKFGTDDDIVLKGLY